MKNRQVHLALIIVSVLYGYAYIVNKFVMKSLPASGLIFCRTVGASLILLFIMRRQFIKAPPTWLHWKKIFILSLFGVIINLIAFMEGLARTTAAHASVINSCIPLLALVFSVLLGTEKLNGKRVLGMVISFFGILLLLEIEKQQWKTDLFIGDLLCVINSCSFALYFALSRKFARDISPMMVTTGMFSIGAIILAPYAAPAAFALHWSQMTPLFYAALLYLIIGSTVITYFLNNWALARVESSFVGLYIFIQPILASWAAHWAFDEPLTGRTIASSLLVFVGVVIGNFLSTTKKKEIYAEPHLG